LTDLQKDLDATKEVTGGADVLLSKMAGQLAGHGLWPIDPHDEGQSPPAR
jgi:hypothetical protein